MAGRRGRSGNAAMNAATLNRDAFMPRPPSGMRAGLGLALLVHVLLVAALAFSVNWHASSPAVAEAELWAAVPQVAAPRAVEIEPPKPVPPVVKPPPPIPKAEPEPQKIPDASIAIEKAKREKALELKEKEKEDLAKKKKEAEQERKAEAALVEARERNIKRILGQAEATGSASAKGAAQQSKDLSASYLGRLRAYIRSNMIFTDSLDGNPVVEIDVRCAPDGTIISRRLSKTSGSKVWDETVLRGLDKAAKLPADVDGTVPAFFTLVYSYRD
jgi:colicin import membrane protein